MTFENLVTNSSTVASIRFDTETGILSVNFMKTGVYNYYECTKEEYDLIATSPSVGKAVRVVLKDKRFKKQ